MKKLTFLLIGLLFSLQAWCIEFEVGGIRYSASNTTASVISKTPGYTGNIAIPNTVTYSGNTYTVASIGWQAFFGCSGLTEVTIPNSVTSIGDRAFYGCSSLGTVNFNADSCISMGESSSVFSDCTALTTVNIGSNVTVIPYYAFKGCTGLISVIIPNSVTNIGYAAFSGCTELTSITIPNNVKNIEYGAFFGCSNLDTVNFNADSCVYTPLLGMYNTVFGGCEDLTIVNIGNNVKYIPDYAFSGCSGLTELIIPNSVTNIGSSAFSSCSGLTNITIPNSVTSIRSSAFSYCSSLATVNFNVESCESMGIGWNSSIFSSCTALTTLNIGNTVKEIPHGAFAGCTGLISITIPNSVTSIGTGAFAGCSGLTTVNFNADSCIYGGGPSYPVLFNECTALTTVNIGQNVKTIPSDAFLFCSLDTVNFNADSCLSGGFSGCWDLTTVNIGNNVKVIPSGAFANCYGLSSIIIPNSVVSIGSHAFSGCSGITSFTFPNNVTSIGSNAFDNTAWYNNQPNGVVYAGKVLYKYKGTMLVNTSIVINQGTLGIASSAFSGCTGLSSIAIPNSINHIGSNTFFGCTGLTSVIIPNNVVSIEENTFSGCTGLTSVTIGNSVSNIGNSAFYDCRSLTSVTIPRSVTHIGDKAFYNCSLIANVYAKSSTPAICQDNTFMGDGFRGIDTRTCILHVPAGSKSLYQTAVGWRDFTNIVPSLFIVSATALPSNGGQITGMDAYDTNSTATLQAIPNQDYIFKYWKENGDSISNLTTYSFTVTKNRILTAVFVKQVIIATVASPNNGGQVMGMGSYDTNSSVTLQATPNLGYTFKYWQENGDSITNRATYSFIATQNRTLTAVFENQIIIAAIVSPENSGQVTGTGFYNPNSSVTLQATPNLGYTFKYWQENGDSISNLTSYNFAATQNRTFVAVFVPQVVNITITAIALPSNGGTVNGGGNYNQGTTVSLQAAPNQGYVFYCWKEGNDSITNQTTYSFSATQDRTLTAVFVAQSGAIHVTGISVNPSLNLQTGGTGNLTATVAPANATNPAVLWVSRNNSVATVNNAGKVTGVAAGSTYIVATTQDGGFKDSCLVTVTAQPKEPEITVVPQANAILITWPKENNASNYTLILFSDAARTQVIGVYEFDSEGKLLTKEATYSHTITGLTAETHYYYSLTAYDEDKQEIKTTKSDFTTLKTTGIEEAQAEEAKFVVYPNPVINGQLTIESGKWNSQTATSLRGTKQSIEIFDLVGKLVGTFAITGEKTEINIGHLPSGTYFVKVGNAVRKITKR